MSNIETMADINNQSVDEYLSRVFGDALDVLEEMMEVLEEVRIEHKGFVLTFKEKSK